MTDAVLKNTLESLQLEKNAPGWLYGLTFRVSVQAYQALSVTLYLLLLHHLSILCIKRTVIVGRNIADLRLIYVPHCREWCYYGKINVPLVVLWGWTGRTHICPHNTTADLAVTGRETERDAAAKRPTVLFIKALSSPRPATDVWHHTVSPASTTGVRRRPANGDGAWCTYGDMAGREIGMLTQVLGLLNPTYFMWHWSTENMIAKQ